MKTETESAANFLVNLLRMRSGDLGEERLGELRDALVKVMRARYEGHWHEDAPPKGCGYRCVRVNTRMDPMVEEAARLCDIDREVVKQGLPTELTVWVDPGEVAYRFGEDYGSYCVLWNSDSNGDKAWESTVNSNNSNNSNSNNSRVTNNNYNNNINKVSTYSRQEVGQAVYTSCGVRCAIAHSTKNYHDIHDIASTTTTSSTTSSLAWPTSLRAASPRKQLPGGRTKSYKNMDVWTSKPGIWEQPERQYA